MRATRAGLLLPLALLLAASCGLPGAYYLEPPSLSGLTPALGSGQSFRLKTTDRSGDIAATFIGYEYYYRCFADLSTLGQYDDYGSEYYDYTTLLNNKFLRLCRGVTTVTGIVADTSPSSSSPPILNMRQIDLLDLPLDDSVTPGTTVYLWINDESINAPAGLGFGAGTHASYLTYSPPSNLPAPVVAMEVRRFVAAPAGCKPFNRNSEVSGYTNWDETGPDADITAELWNAVEAGAGEMHVLVYAVTYGVGDDKSIVRSYPVCLGYTTTTVSP